MKISRTMVSYNASSTRGKRAADKLGNKRCRGKKKYNIRHVYGNKSEGQTEGRYNLQAIVSLRSAVRKGGSRKRMQGNKKRESKKGYRIVTTDSLAVVGGKGENTTLVIREALTETLPAIERGGREGIANWASGKILGRGISGQTLGGKGGKTERGFTLWNIGGQEKSTAHSIFLNLDQEGNKEKTLGGGHLQGI